MPFWYTIQSTFKETNKFHATKKKKKCNQKECELPLGGVSSNGFEATIVSPYVLIGGGGARSCGGIPIGGVLF